MAMDNAGASSDPDDTKPGDDTKELPLGQHDAGPEMQVPPPPGSGEAASRNAVQLARAGAIREFAKTVRRIFTWVVILGLGVLLGIGVIRLFPQVYDVVVSPIERNTQEIADLSQRMTRLESDMGGLAEQGDTFFNNGLATQQAMLDEIATAQAGQLMPLATSQSAAQATLDTQAQRLSTLSDELGRAQSELSALRADSPGNAAYVEYNRQLVLLRAAQELLVARIRLSEQNAGQASAAINAARASIELARAASPLDEQERLSGVLARLDQVQANLTSNPFVAFADLDAAWAELLAAIQPVVLVPASTPTPTPAAIPTPTPGG